MGRRRFHFWVAVAAGFGVSVVLFTLLQVSHSDAEILLRLQYAGFFVSWALLPGSLDSATALDYGLIGLPINGVLYAAIIYAVLRFISRGKRAARA